MDGVNGGRNRTGIQSAPDEVRSAVDGSEWAFLADGEPVALAAERVRVARQSEELGSVPVAESAPRRGAGTAALIDKLGARLAFERTGTRLYDAFLAKVEASGDGGVSRDEVEDFRNDELQHVGLLIDVLEALGADATAQTPSADVAGVLSAGILQVLVDPRTDVSQCLEALLVAELADNDGWRLLSELARSIGQEPLASRFERAMERERAHLAWVRGRIQDRLPQGGTGPVDLLP